LQNVHEIEYAELEKIIPSPGLSLVIRLNLEKYRPHLDEQLEKIGEITGETGWQLEVDLEKTLPLLDQNTQNTIGEIYYKYVIDRLVSNLQNRLKSEMSREAFNEATTQRKIIIRVNDKIPMNWKWIFENGAVVLEHKKNLCNHHEVEYVDFNEIMPVPGVLSLLARLNIANFKEKYDEVLESIKESTGEEYTFDDACLEAVYPKLSAGHQREIGALIARDVLGRLSENLKKNLKDDMVKEAFNEVATAHQITLKCEDNPKSAQAKANQNWKMSFENGFIVLTFLPAFHNMHEIEYIELEKLL